MGNLRAALITRVLEELFVYGWDLSEPPPPAFGDNPFRYAGLIASTGSEVVSSGYARQLVSSWTIDTGVTPYTAKNAAVVTWNSGAYDWGTIAGVALYNAATSGDEGARIAIVSYPMGPGVTLTIDVGQLTFYFD